VRWSESGYDVVKTFELGKFHCFIIIIVNTVDIVYRILSQIMKPDPVKTIKVSESHRIEIGASSWNASETSIRNRYDGQETGRFNPHSSSEIPLNDIELILKAASQHDLLKVSACARIIEVLATSIVRQRATVQV
jgi:hypothetical protein